MINLILAANRRMDLENLMNLVMTMLLKVNHRVHLTGQETAHHPKIPLAVVLQTMRVMVTRTERAVQVETAETVKVMGIMAPAITADPMAENRPVAIIQKVITPVVTTAVVVVTGVKSHNFNN